MSTAPIGMTLHDQAVHYLARQLFLELCRMRGFTDIDPVPHVPRWATDYAAIAVSYLGVDDESVAQLARDYK